MLKNSFFKSQDLRKQRTNTLKMNYLVLNRQSSKLFRWKCRILFCFSRILHQSSCSNSYSWYEFIINQVSRILFFSQDSSSVFGQVRISRNIHFSAYSMSFGGLFSYVESRFHVSRFVRIELSDGTMETFYEQTRLSMGFIGFTNIWTSSSGILRWTPSLADYQQTRTTLSTVNFLRTTSFSFSMFVFQMETSIEEISSQLSDNHVLFGDIIDNLLYLLSNSSKNW